MTLKEQILILEYWGYNNSDMSELLQHKRSIIATLSWQIRNRERHNFHNILSYARNAENNRLKQRAARAKLSLEERQEISYKRKCREAGVEYVDLRTGRKVLPNTKRDEGASV